MAGGIVLGKPEQNEDVILKGFTFLLLGADSGMVSEGMKKAASILNSHKSSSKK